MKDAGPGTGAPVFCVGLGRKMGQGETLQVAFSQGEVVTMQGGHSGI